MTDRTVLIAWLRDAYAMEQQAIDLLEAQSRRLRHYPELEAKVNRHLIESRDQADRVQACLRRLGTDVSLLKAGIARLTANMQTIMTAATADEVVKNAVADYAFEHLEIGTYRCLIAAARDYGDAEIARVCEEILHQEEAMAAWLGEHLAVIAGEYLRRQDDFDFTNAKG
jgi:ferritin-like metal-binding protein YciE